MKKLLYIFILAIGSCLFCFNTNAQNVDLPIDTSNVGRHVETIPEFKGGVRGFDKFLNKNIKYPNQARQDNIRGRVIITFVVEKDGPLPV